MPPAVVPLLLIAIGIPAALRALIGRPRALGTGWLATAAAVALAQILGELTGSRVGVLGDAQILYAAVAALVVSLALAWAERRP